MRSVPLLLTAVICLIGLVPDAVAFPVPNPPELSKIIPAAQVIVEARLLRFTPDVKYSSGIFPEPYRSGMVRRGQEAGLYTFRVIRALQGTAPKALTLGLPEAFPGYYDLSLTTASRRDAPLRLLPGETALLFLRRDGHGSLGPVDVTLPWVRVQDDGKATSLTGRSPQAKVVSLLLLSLRDPARRHVVLYLLRTLTDARIPAAVRPYATDPETAVRDNALYCLIANQQVDAIPRVIALDTDLTRRNPDSGASSVMALERLTTARAIPYLNPLLFDRSPGVRLEALMALRNLADDHGIADTSSIPYLILCLRDPTPYEDVSGGSYLLLHEIIPSLGPGVDLPYFRAHRAEIVQQLDDWWRDEMAGKHSAPAPAPPVTAESRPQK